MVIENQILKTEMVYEIKDEYKIPSYEEFLKTYESDGKVNYADLGSSDIGEIKGYGPCDSSRNNQTFKLYLVMYNYHGRGIGKGAFYSPEQALSEATDIVLCQNGWQDNGISESYGSGLRREAANAIKSAVEIYRLGGSVNGWLEINESFWSGKITETHNYTCGTNRNGDRL